MDWSGARVFVTGAGGFIGSHLCQALLDRGAKVTAMIHYSNRGDWGNLEFLSEPQKTALKVVAGNIEDYNFVQQAMEGSDVVFHLAALIAIPYSYVAPSSYVRVNVCGTLNVCEAARKLGVRRLVHTSTSETYGTAQYTPMDEAHPLQAQSPYSASKIGADKIAESYFRSFDLPIATIRPFNTYGPRQSARAFIPAVITQALYSDEVRLGSLDPVRDLTYVKDTAAAFLAVASSEEAIGKVTNAGSGRGFKVGEVAKTILRLMDCKKEIVQDPARVRPEASEVYELICDNSKARERGWTPQVSLEDGLKATIDFIKEKLYLYKPGLYTL